MRLLLSVSPKFARTVALILMAVIILLSLTSVIWQAIYYALGTSLDGPAKYIVFQVSELFNVDTERSFPTMYSAYALLVCAHLIALIAYVKRVARDSYARHWMSLAFIFVALSVDEAFTFHEKAIDLADVLGTGGFLKFAWVIPGSIFVLFFGLAYLKFLIHLPSKMRLLFVLSGTTYVLGALGMEMVDGYFSDLYGSDSFIYVLLVALEEFLEMMGIVIFVYTLLLYIAEHLREVNIVSGKRRLGREREKELG